MSYWDNYDVSQLYIIKEKLLSFANNLENELKIFTDLIDDINNSIIGRRY